MSCKNWTQTIGATSLTAQMVRSTCETPTAECELECGGDKTPTARSEWYCGRRRSTGGSDYCGGERTPTARSDLENKIMDNLQRVEGTMVTKEC